MSDEKIVFHGGATSQSSIGQRSDTIYRKLNGEMVRIMVDCGIEFQRSGEAGASGPNPDFSYLGEDKVDVLVGTHSHTDHIGAFPSLINQGYCTPDTRLFAAPQTHAVLPYVYEDGLRQDSTTYNVLDAIQAIDPKRQAVIAKPGEVELLPGLTAFVAPAGHIPGALSIVIPTSSGINGLITGDICWHDQPVVKGAELPSLSWPKKYIPDEIWGTDLTYGSGQKKSLSDEVSRLIAEVKLAYKEGKKIVIAAFANGRTQNIAAWLHEAGIPCYIDGMGRKLYHVFQAHRWSDRDGTLPDIDDSNIRLVESREDRENILRRTDPWVVVTTGGMGDFGPIVGYLEHGLPHKDFCFFFTSYLAPGTTGDHLMRLNKRRMLQAPKVPERVKIEKKDETKVAVPFVASVDRFSLSAHGDLDDFTRFVEDIISCRGGEPLRRIILTHGTAETKIKAAERFKNLTKQIIWGERNTVVSLD